MHTIPTERKGEVGQQVHRGLGVGGKENMEAIEEYKGAVESDSRNEAERLA